MIYLPIEPDHLKPPLSMLTFQGLMIVLGAYLDERGMDDTSDPTHAPPASR